MGPKSFCVLIVNYHGREDTIACVDSVLLAAKQSVNRVKIVVVDNSTDHFDFSDQSVHILRTGHNIGLSGAWYVGFYSEIAQSCEYIIFLNNDAVIAESFFTQLQAGCKKWGADCAFGPRIYYSSDHSLIWSRGGVIQRFHVRVKHFGERVRATQLETEDFETGHLSGCCLIVPRNNLNKIGGPDTNFFFRGEEWDMNYRLSQAGVKLVILDRVEVFHKINRSHDRFSPTMLYLAYRAKVLFAKKILPWWYFPIWYVVGLSYAATVSPIRFSRASRNDPGKLRRALVSAFIEGLNNDKIVQTATNDW